MASELSRLPKDEALAQDATLVSADVTEQIRGNASDLLLPPNTEIKGADIIESYGKRIDELRKKPLGRKKIGIDELAQVCGTSKQTISTIISGKTKSVNIDFCNKLARYFDCSAYYLLGLTDNVKGISVNSKDYKIPFVFFTEQENINIVQTRRWAEIDPELFGVLPKVFSLPLSERQAIYNILKLIVRNAQEVQKTQEVQENQEA